MRILLLKGEEKNIILNLLLLLHILLSNYASFPPSKQPFKIRIMRSSIFLVVPFAAVALGQVVRFPLSFLSPLSSAPNEYSTNTKTPMPTALLTKARLY